MNIPADAVAAAWVAYQQVERDADQWTADPREAGLRAGLAAAAPYIAAQALRDAAEGLADFGAGLAAHNWLLQRADELDPR
jgi:hypothetical protein